MDRQGSFGQDRQPTLVDRFGIWLSMRQLQRVLGPLKGARLLDIGSGFEASATRQVLDNLEAATVVDVSLSDGVKALKKVTAVEGLLPEALTRLEAASFERIVFNNVLEHLHERQKALDEVHRLLTPGGIAFINVPSWRGKVFLEYAAFRLGMSPAEEMEDHKIYYDPKDLLPMLVEAGSRPSHISCRRHKFGLNTYAICRKAES